MSDKEQWQVLPLPAPVSGLGGAFTKGQLRAILTVDGGRQHLSVSCADRYPTWDEIADARYHFCKSDADMAIILPPAKDYINYHPFTFHVWEIVDSHLPIERDIPDMPRTHVDGEVQHDGGGQ